MKKTYLIIAVFFIAFVGSLNVQAQTWTAPSPVGTAFAAGTGYYVYNVGGKSFLDRGADWSTMAALGSGALITTVQSTTLWILQYDGSTKTLFPGGTTDGSVFTDNSTSNTWDVQITDAVNNVYSIQVASTYGGYNASQYLGASATVFNSNRGLAYDVRYNRAASVYTQWKFCTAADFAKYNAQVRLDKYMKIAKLVGSSVDLTSYISTYNTGTTAEINTAAAALNVALAPTDKTTSITNPNFDSAPTTEWTRTGGFGYNFTEIEYWQASSDFNQTLTGLPAGVYILKAQGLERPSNLSTADHTIYTNGWDALNSKLYATASGVKTFQPLKNLYAETTCTVGSTIDGLIFPNSMSDAQAAFTAGLYDNELNYVTVDATGSLTIGISNVYDNNRAGRWLLFDNFRLYYYGALTIPNISVSQTSLFINNAIETSKTVNITGSNLTGNVTITAPAGITLTGTNLVDNGGGSYTIALANANATTTITATWDESANLTGTIVVASTDATSQNIAIATSKDKDCFTPLYSSLTNLITDTYCNSLDSYAGWGSKSIVTDYVYCGGRSIKISGKCGGSLDFNLTGKIQGAKTYRVKAMVSTNGTGETKIGVSGATATGITNVISTAAGEWLPVDFTFTTDATVTSSNMYLNSCETQTATESYIDNYEMYDITGVITGVKSLGIESTKVYSSSKTIVADINLESSAKVEFSVFNAQGMLLSNTSSTLVSGNNHQVINANLPSGLYFVKITMNGKSATTKVIK